MGFFVLFSLEVVGDIDRCLGRMVGLVEYLGYGSVGSLWIFGLLVEIGVIVRVLRR